MPINFSIPGEYRKVANRLFPEAALAEAAKAETARAETVSAESQAPDLKAIAEFAKALGVGTEYQRLNALDSGSKELQTFLEHFQYNLDLLIRKTWIEKKDESRKDTLQDQIPSLMTAIEQGNFEKSIEEFSAILDEIAYLLFGTQSEKDDFAEYTFRIDEQMGLFWWYGSKLSSFKNFKNEKISWAVLLLGLCYLTNF